MGKNYFILFSLLLAASHVTSFSISARQKRGADLAEALAILQRQRRRVGTEHLSAGRVIHRRPLTLDDVNDLLRSSEDADENIGGNLEKNWASKADFADFQPRLEYDASGRNNGPLVSVSVKPSRRELEDIFESDDVDGNISHSPVTYDSLPEKKTKEEMINVKGDGKIVQKKSFLSNVAEVTASFKEEGGSHDGPSQETLTKEEFHVLMKAVEKLQKQAVKFDEKIIETPEAKVTVVEALEKSGEPKEITIIQPASKEELKSVFKGDETPVVKETEVLVEKAPDESEERIVQKQVVSNVSPKEAKELKDKEADLISSIATELEDSIATEAEDENEIHETEEQEIEDLNTAINEYKAETENEWATRDREVPLQKRTAKREVSSTLQPNYETFDDADAGNIDVRDYLDLVTASLAKAKSRILELENQVDRLEEIAELEDEENDFLTDALNEATMVPQDNVSEKELEYLQKAIRIEEELQKMKVSPVRRKYPDVFVKRGEPWRRKSGPDVDRESNVIDEEGFSSLSPLQQADVGVGSTSRDLQRIPDPSFFREAGATEKNVASFFISNAGECPAIQEYSTNCELADLYSLPVDYEARSLCNLHEMCYTCGSSLHIGQDQCDLVYQAAASTLCRGKQKCVLESEVFLRTMKLKQRYIPHSQNLCRSTCVMQFLGTL